MFVRGNTIGIQEAIFFHLLNDLLLSPGLPIRSPTSNSSTCSTSHTTTHETHQGGITQVDIRIEGSSEKPIHGASAGRLQESRSCLAENDSCLKYKTHAETGLRIYKSNQNARRNS
jgi:hypothetical protein